MSKSRRYQVTIFDVENYTEEKMIECFINLGVSYGISQMSNGEESKKDHIHVYLVFDNARHFSSIKKEFPNAHIEACKGNNKDNYEYVTKTGKHNNEDTYPETKVEIGTLPEDRQGKRTDWDNIKTMVDDGWEYHDILEENPSNYAKRDTIKAMIEEKKKAEYSKNMKRNCIYLYGDSGEGKSTYLHNTYGESLYTIDDYSHPYDDYEYQETIAYEEFHSDRPINELLKITDVFPNRFGCRYGNKQNCCKNIVIISNIPLNQQYVDVDSKTKTAFYRRFDYVYRVINGELILEALKSNDGKRLIDKWGKEYE